MKKIIILLLISISIYSKNKLNDKEFEIYLLKASNFFSLKDYKSGIGYLKDALLHKPEEPYNKFYIAMFLSGVKKYLTSLDLIIKLDSLKNDQIVLFYKYYDYYYSKKSLNKIGILNFKKLKKELINSNNHLTKDKLLFLSVTYYLDSDKTSSLMFFRKAIKRDPNLLSLGYEINFARDIVYTIYKKLSPPYDVYYYNSLGRLQIKFKDYKNAIKTLNKSIKLDKNNFLAKKLLAIIYLSLRKYDLSLKYLKEVKLFYNDKEEIYLMFNNIYKHKKNYKEALKICQEGLSLIQYSQSLRYCVAEGLYNKKNYKGALFNLEYLIDQFPDSADINFLLGETLEALIEKISFEEDEYKRIIMGEKYLNNFSKPNDYYQRALELDPINPKIVKKMLFSFMKNLKQKSLKAGDTRPFKLIDTANEAYLEYYEPFAERENLENYNLKFNENFIKYFNNKSKEALKQMSYLPIGKTMLKYISFFNKQDDEKLFSDFMSIYSKKYIKLRNSNHKLNQFLYEHKLRKVSRNIQQLKIFDFIIPSYFD